MITHDDILGALVGAFPSVNGPSARGAVRLLARYDDPALKLPAGLAHVFIPDCHMLTPEDAERFARFAFSLDGDFELFLRAMLGLYRDHRREMLFYQLGDILDLWRTLGGGGDHVEARSIAAHYTRIMTLLRSQAPEGLNAVVLAGNHDFALRQLGDWLAPRFLGIGGRTHRGGKALILHGDAFDWIEGLPDAVQAFVVRLVKSRKSGRKDLGALEEQIVREVNRRLPIEAGADPFGSGEAHPGPWLDDLEPRWNTPDAGGAVVRFYDGALRLAEESVRQGEDLRLVVIGHTHHARIVAGRRSDGKPLVLMDCGAWSGTFQVPGSGDVIMRAQVGVLVGNDARVYQVGYRRPGP